ncbi:hypothetical protein AVEN_12264-1 [Araneus ventricosus]|uniref:Uncharacterized protein n=1 Tax=Araneus ventricosus TaxID=182803 RepID=A0A4Y2Q139_ARAVE|nr:hypothetical protein AVEN_12264-1 [Araneus ventricosus]
MSNRRLSCGEFLCIPRSLNVGELIPGNCAFMFATFVLSPAPICPKHSCDWTSIPQIYSGRNSDHTYVSRDSAARISVHSNLNVIVILFLYLILCFSYILNTTGILDVIPQIYSGRNSDHTYVNRDSAENFYAFQSLI